MREAQAPPSRVGWPQAYPGSRMQLAGCAGERGLPEQAGKSPTVCGAGGPVGMWAGCHRRSRERGQVASSNTELSSWAWGEYKPRSRSRSALVLQALESERSSKSGRDLGSFWAGEMSMGRGRRQGGLGTLVPGLDRQGQWQHQRQTPWGQGSGPAVRPEGGGRWGPAVAPCLLCV